VDDVLLALGKALQSCCNFECFIEDISQKNNMKFKPSNILKYKDNTSINYLNSIISENTPTAKKNLELLLNAIYSWEQLTLKLSYKHYDEIIRGDNDQELTTKIKNLQKNIIQINKLLMIKKREHDAKITTP
jgi:hypothetical protein